MCELNGTGMDAATAASIKPVNDVFDNVFSIFDAAHKRARMQVREIRPITQDDDEPPPRKSA